MINVVKLQEDGELGRMDERAREGKKCNRPEVGCLLCRNCERQFRCELYMMATFALSRMETDANRLLRPGAAVTVSQSMTSVFANLHDLFRKKSCLSILLLKNEQNCYRGFRVIAERLLRCNQMHCIEV